MPEKKCGVCNCMIWNLRLGLCEKHTKMYRQNQQQFIEEQRIFNKKKEERIERALQWRVTVIWRTKYRDLNRQFAALKRKIVLRKRTIIGIMEAKPTMYTFQNLVISDTRINALYRELDMLVSIIATTRKEIELQILQ